MLDFPFFDKRLTAVFTGKSGEYQPPGAVVDKVWTKAARRSQTLLSGAKLC